MRLARRIGAISVALAVVAAPALARVAFEDNKLNFKSCDGQNLTARWRDNNFHLSVPGRTIEPAAPELKYLGWDGACRTMSVDGKGRFQHAHGGTTNANHVINYVSWDDTKWSATRAGTGFFTVFVAGKGEPASDASLKDAASWLKRNKADSRAGSLLAHELSGISAE